MATKRIPLSEASPAQLRHQASVIMGIDGINPHQSSSTLIGKILSVDSTITEIEVEAQDEAQAQPQPAQPASAPSPSNPPAAAPRNAEPELSPRQLAHHRFDPTVRVFIGEPYDGSRVKDVILSVNGVSLTLRRGMEHDIPYRFYLSLAGAKETFMVDTDELHPQTGLPIKEPRERPTISHSLVGPLPSPEQIAEFMRRTEDVSM